MLKRGRARFAAASVASAAILAWISLLLASCGSATTGAIASATLAPSTPTPSASTPPDGVGSSVTNCVRKLSHAAGGHLLVVIGASFTAGVGSGTPNRSWAVVLARTLHWNAVVYGVSGAGYTWPGAGREGPVSAEIARIDLKALNPSLIIVQAGHDDMRVRPDLEEQHVTQTIKQLRAEAPRARIALVTVFPGHAKLSRALNTDSIIVSAAIAADPNVIIMDPLVGHWNYPHARDGLHPTVAGSEWLARKVGQVLGGYGITPARQPGSSVKHGLSIPMVCDYSSVGSHRRIKVPPPPEGLTVRIQPP